MPKGTTDAKIKSTSSRCGMYLSMGIFLLMPIPREMYEGTELVSRYQNLYGAVSVL